MKKFLIYFASFLILFGTSAAFANPIFLDLSDQANHDGVSALTKSYTNLPKEEVIYSLGTNTPFKITESNDGNIFIVLAGSEFSGMPDSVEIQLQDYAETIHFFGSIHYGIPTNEIIGKYVINYDDSSTVEILLDNNELSPQWNTDDHCCNWRSKDIPDALLAWEDSTQSEKRTLIREFIWENLDPSKKITSIEFLSFNTENPNPVLAAITYFPVADTTIEVNIDIEPGKCPNPVDVKTAEIVKIAVLGDDSHGFNVQNIDPETIHLSREGYSGEIAPIEWKYKDTSTPFNGELCNCHKLKGDGQTDLVLKFNAQEVIELLGLDQNIGETIALILTGLADEGETPIVGQDCVWMKTEDTPFPLDVEAGAYSVYESWNHEYYISFQVLDPNHVLDSVTVTGPGIDGSWPLFNGGSGSWGTPSFFGLGQNPPTPPLTYTFHIKSAGKAYNIDEIIQSFNENVITNLAPTGAASWPITFTWDRISLPDAVYFVQLSEENGSMNWTSRSTMDNFVSYTDDPPLSPGSLYFYNVWARDSFGNYSVAQVEFVYSEPQPAEIVFQPGPVDGMDVYITSVYSGGGVDNEELKVGGWGDYYYSLIKFNIDSLPSVVNSAKIYLWEMIESSGYAPIAMQLDRVTSSWDENTKWSDRPSFVHLSTIQAPVRLSWYSIDITEIYNGWKTGTYENHGIQLRPTNNWHTLNKFASSDYMENPNLRPKLVIVPSEPQEEIYIFERMWPELHSPWYFNSPAYVATDNNDRVYISDYNNNQIQVFTANGDLLSKWPITEYGGYEFHLPRAITVDQNGFVYVVAYDSNSNSSILKLNPSGEIVDRIGNYADFPGTCGFSNPCAIDVDNSGNFYVTDEVNQRIEKLAPDGTLITTWGSFGTGNGEFHEPTGIAVDRQRNFVYVLDNRNLRTQKFTTDGVYLAQWQSIDSATDYGGVGIAVDDDGYVYVSNTASNEIRKFTGAGELEATLYNIVHGSFGIAIDSGGYIYCADFHGNRVEKISPDGNQNWIWTSAGIENGYFHAPVDVALNRNGNVYVADYVNARIQKFDSLGNFISAWHPSCIPGSIAIDASDNVYVMCGSFVSKYDANGGFIKEWGSEGTGDGQFSWTIGIAVDDDGYVYVVDTGNFRIQKFTSDGEFVTKWGSQGTGEGQFILPWAIDVDNGNVYVTDSDQHNVQIFTTDGEFVAKWEEQGFGAPRGIAVDESNNVYVCSVKGYIQKLTSEGVLITEFGDSGSEPGYIAGPNGIEVDSAERIYVADTNNNRIQVFTKVLP